MALPYAPITANLIGVEADSRSGTLPRTFFITTMGCQMNAYDSDLLAQSLIQMGYSPVDHPKGADLILINTCTVRAKPKQKAFSLIGRMTAVKERRPDLILGVVGCLAQQEGSELLKRFPLLDLVMGPRELDRIPDILKRIETDRERIVATRLETTPFQRNQCPGYFDGRITGYISIMEGCNNFCSYCIVPFVRGREISRSPHDIFTEAKNLISEGVKEITLLGQNVNSYVWEAEEGWGFVSLLWEVSKLEGLLRLRFVTSHPKDLSDDLIDMFGHTQNLCPHIHLPFQAGSNSVLKRMRRGYTREEYIALIRKLRAVRPDIAVSSDVMVGFPGESEADFEMTLDLIQQVQFDTLFSFKYSDRAGTSAAKMGNKVGETEKALRLRALQDLQRQITLKKNRDLEGRQLEVLVEGESKRGGQLTGRTGSNKIVNMIGDHNQIGHLVKVTIRDGLLNSLRAER